MSILERLEDLEETSLVNLRSHVIGRQAQGRMLQGIHFLFDFRKDVLPDNGFKDGEQDDDGQVVERSQAVLDLAGDFLPVEEVETVISFQTLLPGQGVSVAATKPAHEPEVALGVLIPLPGFVEALHLISLRNAASNRSRVNRVVFGSASRAMRHSSCPPRIKR